MTELVRNTQQFIERSNIIHNNVWDYSKTVYKKSIEKVFIGCSVHGYFLQTPNKHLMGRGCYECGRLVSANKQRKPQENFIRDAKEKYGDKYDYSFVIYVNSKTKVLITCGKHHGNFEQTPANHLWGYECCNECVKEKTSLLFRDTLENFIKKAKLVHGDKWDYSISIYGNNSFDNIKIKCREHGVFEQRPNNHIQGKQGCPKCQIKKQYSKAQIQWLNFVNLYYNITIQHAENGNEYLIQNTKYKADGYCEETNTVYEFHGDYWHGNPNIFIPTKINKTTNTTFGELYQKTLNREQEIRDLGYNLVIMWEHDWNKINTSMCVLQRKFKKSYTKK